MHFTSADCKMVYRSSYKGENRTVVYETEHEITCLRYTEGGYLCVTEENKRAVLVEIPTGTVTVVAEGDYVKNACYYTNLSDERGPFVLWTGEPSDAHPNRVHAYFFYLKTGEIEDHFVR